MHKVIRIENDIVNQLTIELKKFKNIFTDLPLNFSDDRLSLINTSDRDILKKTFEVINSSIILSKITAEDLKIDLDKYLRTPMLWTYPQLRIDCDANRVFSAPFHKDGFILGEKLKGIVIWIPINFEGGSLEVITEEGETLIKRNEYWGLECECEKYESEKIKINFGEALVFDESCIHRSSPIKKGQITLQLRYFEPSTEFFYRPIVQKSSQEISDFQNKYK